MQELEKILEEINQEKKNAALSIRHTTGYKAGQIRIAERIEEIIRKHMNDDNEIMEQCPYCENEAALHWDVEKDGHQVFCPNCGKPMMLCSMCDARDGAVCDWKEGEGCKHSDERYRDYFRKHMNDGWISVEDRLPEEKGMYLVTYHPCYWDDVNPEVEVGIDTFRGKTTWAKKKFQRVIAWQPLPEPYRPERSKNDSKRF